MESVTLKLEAGSVLEEALGLGLALMDLTGSHLTQTPVWLSCPAPHCCVPLRSPGVIAVELTMGWRWDFGWYG